MRGLRASHNCSPLKGKLIYRLAATLRRQTFISVRTISVKATYRRSLSPIQSWTMPDWLPDSKLLIFQRYTSSLVTFCVGKSHLIPRLSRPSSYTSCKWSSSPRPQQVIMAIVVGHSCSCLLNGCASLTSIGCPEVRTSFPHFARSRWIDFQLGGETVQVVTLLPHREDIILSGFWSTFKLSRYLNSVDELHYRPSRNFYWVHNGYYLLTN